MESNLRCRNCGADIPHSANYCNACGARHVTERITFKRQLGDVANSLFGWDNLFFATIKALIVNPDRIFKDYIGGVRKKYSNPFTFFAINAAISLLIFNFFADKYIEQMSSVNEAQADMMAKYLPKPQATSPDTISTGTERTKPTIDAEAFKKEVMDKTASVQRAMLTYYNLAAFALLPLYAFIAFIVFGKPYNYGEQLVVNAYIQGLMMLCSTIAFMADLLTGWPIFTITLFAQIIYYLYAYRRLYRHSAEDVLVSFLRFIGFLTAGILSFFVLSLLLGILVGKVFSLLAAS